LSINQKTSQFHDNEYHDPQGGTHAKGLHQINPFAALTLIHLIFISTDFKTALIEFPYRSMRQLY
jgi:hypothetical protein